MRSCPSFRYSISLCAGPSVRRRRMLPIGFSPSYQFREPKWVRLEPGGREFSVPHHQRRNGLLRHERADRQGLERLLRYCGRPAFALEQPRDLVAAFKATITGLSTSSPVRSHTNSGRRPKSWRTQTPSRTPLDVCVLGQYLGLGGRQQGIEATQNRQRENDLAVLVALVRTSKQVADTPNEVGQLGVVLSPGVTLPHPDGGEI